MSLQFKKLIEDMADQLGYTEINRLGSGHLEAIHPNGAKVRLPLTPRNEWREKRNSRALLERGAGRKLPRDNSGKVKCRTPKKEGFIDTYASQKSEHSLERDRIFAEVEALDAKVRDLARENTYRSYAKAKDLMFKRTSIDKEAAAKGIRIHEFML